jgi:hypothetical protein
VLLSRLLIYVLGLKRALPSGLSLQLLITRRVCYPMDSINLILNWTHINQRPKWEGCRRARSHVSCLNCTLSVSIKIKRVGFKRQPPIGRVAILQLGLFSPTERVN